MRQMKNSGIEWIGEIPNNWEMIPIKYLASYNDETLAENTAPDFEFDYIEIGSVEYGKGITSKEHLKFSQAPSRARRIVRANDIIVSTVRTYLRAVAPITFFENEQIVSTGFIVIRPKNVVSSFLKYAIVSENFICTVEANSTGISYPAINASQVVQIKIPVPSTAEQQRIAAFLDRKCAEIDAVIEKTKSTIEEYKALKRSIITEAVTKGIRGNCEMKETGIKWIGTIPSDWNLIQIKYLKSNDKNAFVDGPFGSNLKSIHFVEDGDVYVVESGFITTGKFVFKKFKTITASHFETIRRSECKGKDVIIAKIGANFGMAAELPELDKPSVVSGNSLKITLNQEKILNSIFVYELSVAKNRAGYVGLYNETAQPALSLSALNSFKLVVAPMEEQQEIVDYLDKKCSEIDTLIAKKTALLEEMENYKKSVIYEYVTGKKEVER